MKYLKTLLRDLGKMGKGIKKVLAYSGLFLALTFGGYALQVFFFPSPNYR